MPYTTSVLLQFAIAAPVYLVWCVGIVLAALRYREAPDTSRLVLIALILLLVMGVIGTVADAVLPVLILRGELGVGRTDLVLGVVRAIVDTAGWVLLLVALFSRRRPGKSQVVTS